jgi:hypothetical protein
MDEPPELIDLRSHHVLCRVGPPMPPPENKKAGAQAPFPQSLCHRCSASKYVQTKTSVFVLCTAIPERKYPPQPVPECDLFKEKPRS